MLLDGIFSNLVSNAGEFVGDHVVHENAERWSREVTFPTWIHQMF